MKMKIDHIAVVVPKIEEAIASYAALGYVVIDHVHLNGPDYYCSIVLMKHRLGQAGIELLCPDDERSKFFGHAGLHHYAFAVDDFVSACENLEFAGVTWEGAVMRGYLRRKFRFGILGGVTIEVIESL